MKFTSIAVIGLMGWAGYGISTIEPNSEEIQTAHLKQCQSEFGAENIIRINKYASTADCRFTDAYEEAQEAIKVAAKTKAEQEKVLAGAKKVEKDRIAEEKRQVFLASPEGKTKSFTSRASTLCRQDVRARSKFPTKVDFNWLDGNASKYWMNFSEGKSRVMIQTAGEMMNGFGMMIPFRATCKYDFDPMANKYSTVEVLI